MPTPWKIRGYEYGNCNCDWGCPCQFNAPTTHGNCQGFGAGHVEEGHHGDTKLDGLNWAMIFWWPGEIAEGNGRMQVVIDERADEAQREALRRIVHGEDTEPGATHFQVFSTTVSEVLDTLYLPIDIEFDMEACTAKVDVPGLIQATGTPIPDPFSGEPHRVQIHLAKGFEYTVAEIGSGTATITGGVPMELKDSYGQFNEIHMTQAGLVR